MHGTTNKDSTTTMGHLIQKMVPEHILFLVMAAYMLPSCVLVRPPKEVIGLVREMHTGEPIAGAIAELEYRDDTLHAAWQNRPLCESDSLGVFGFQHMRHLMRKARHQDVLHLKVSQGDMVRTFQLNGYTKLIDIRFDLGHAIKEPPKPVADMHYHISMRAHNHFGQSLYANSKLGDLEPVPDDITWHKSLSKLRWIGPGGRKRYAPKLKYKKIHRATLNHNNLEGAYRSILIDGTVHSKTGNNSLQAYTQATHPHMREGSVMLGYNAISPFEQNLNGMRPTRWFGSMLKSGAHLAWLNRLGSDCNKHLMTHWENFNLEYEMMAQQKKGHDGFNWRFLKTGAQLDEAPTQPTIVTVIEGGHLFQHRLFPNKLNYDLARRTDDEQRELIDDWQAMKKANLLSFSESASVEEVLLQRTLLSMAKKASKLPGTTEERDLGLELRQQANAELYDLVDTVLFREIRATIDSVRRFTDPPVHMVTVAHLSYNGMMGHAPALDDAGFFGAFVAKKVYDMRLSNDPSYIRQWSRLFFTVPGVNRFGKEMMKQLLGDGTERRIFMDLKHSDLMTRQYFFDSIMPQGIPPICSHCAVTGMSRSFWSPFNNEYNISRADFTKTFYPFGINLYDEEIVTIHRKKGIIGIPLEQRILGGYVNKRSTYGYRLNCRGRYKIRTKFLSKQIKPQRLKRWERAKRLMEWAYRADPVHHPKEISDAQVSAMRTYVDSAMAYSHRRYPQLRNEKAALRLTTKELVSIAPFIQNLFYMVDRIMDDTCKTSDCGGDTLLLRWAWSRVCIGSDLDGLIDPIDAVPTAGHYPMFRARLEQFIPLFLEFRSVQKPPLIGRDEQNDFRVLSDYFRPGFEINDALDQLFYKSLRDFTATNFR